MKYKFLDIPFLPKEDVLAVIIDGRTPQILTNKLKNMSIHIVKTPFCKELYDAISYHPDILLHPVDGKDFVVAPNVYEILKEPLKKLGLNVIKGETFLLRNYPENIAYNIARVSNFAIHNLKYTDKVTLKLLEKSGVEFIHVKQGYSKCSICVVSEKAIITSDRGIAKKVEKYGIETLLISPGYIDLPGLSYGFIGGISGFIGKNKLAFSGHLRNHPDYERILDFLSNQQVEPVFLDDKKPIDIGSIIPFLEMAY
ncbi:hypothetical protein FQB35_09310 [Crassaminicella thermophila]|uniref:DUF6873 domain-containing protein n=1 Tax=Crassaminicella thermophila TaxID=2599308 RepID=A0A5C0SFM8_CRATE|nr:hypothetical protein [Crassaminicella thermophila]QEK12507.1 hypothetical protein FQB35_09310 [Crassaminicella thermophila]